MILACMAMTLMLVACDKNDSPDPGTGELSGTFMGTFSRTGMDTSGVTLEFNENSFQGQTIQPRYPAICRGSFVLHESTITFTDSCVWTADFDWTLILNGNYNISFTADETIRIWRTNGTVTDEYLLRKLTR